MNRDTLKISKSHASPVIKKALLTLLLSGCVSIFASDSQTPVTRLNKLACTNPSEASNLRGFAVRINEIFKEFFDIHNNQPLSYHKTVFMVTINDLNSFLSNAKVDRAAHKEIAHIIKELRNFVETLDNNTRPIVVKRGRVTLADIIPLASPFKQFSHLIPDCYFANYNNLLNSLMHRLNC
jgi:hypothetical protein